MISSEFNLSTKIVAGVAVVAGALSLASSCEPRGAAAEQQKRPIDRANVVQLQEDPNFDQKGAGAANRAEGVSGVRCTEAVASLIDGILVVDVTAKPVPHGAKLKLKFQSSYGTAKGYVDDLHAKVADPGIGDGAYGRLYASVEYPTGGKTHPVGVAPCDPVGISKPEA